MYSLLTHLVRRLLVSALCLVVLIAWFTGSSATGFAQVDETSSALRSTILRGALPQQYDSDFLSVEPLIRDGNIVLTLAYDPYSDPKLKGQINIYVLDEDGLRQFTAGDDLDDRELAAGAPLPFDPIGNKLRASFKDSGRGKYTVVVFNNSTTPIDYTLSVVGGMLIDDSGQTTIPAEVAGDALPATNRLPTPTPTPDPFAGVGSLPVKARRVTGALDDVIKRHFLSIDSDIRDDIIELSLTYNPAELKALEGNVNFWVLDDDGFRRMVRGDDPREYNVATGFPSPLTENDNVLLASFKPSGEYNYNVIIFNESGERATYALAVEGGLLLDLYGQTNESRAAALEQAALESSAVGLASDTEPSIGSAGAAPNYNPALTGRLNQAYEHHYFGLTPTIRDGVIVLTMDFEPKFNQTLAENINFWVVDEDGWRRIISGARPSDHDIATGAPIQYGPDRGKLRAVFNASGKGTYTVVVYNDSDVPAQYSLRAEGGLLEDASDQAEALP